MQSFTFGSDEAMAAVVGVVEAGTEPYDMSLNADDFASVVFALREYGVNGTPGESRDRALSLLSGIAETLGIEFV